MPRLPSFTEHFMTGSVRDFLKHTHIDLPKCDIVVSELSLEGCKFDVVGYSKDRRTFYVVECKKGGRATDIGHAFGQILVYQSVISNKGQDFCDRFIERAQDQGSKFNPKDFRALFQEKELPFRFFVSLRAETCRNVPLIRLMKGNMGNMGNVGIISVTRDGKCNDYIPTEKKKRDHSIAKSEPINIPVMGPPKLDAFLEEAKADDKIRDIVRELVQKIEALETGIFLKFIGNRIVFRTAQNFCRVSVRKKGIVADVYKNGKSWVHDPGKLLRRQSAGSKWTNTRMIKSADELVGLLPLVRRAVKLSQK